MSSELRAARREVLARAGGTYDTGAVAKLLGITREAVQDRVDRGALVSYLTGTGERRYPRVQFTGEGTIEGLEDVLDAMHVSHPWMRMQLLVDDDVLDALRDGRIEDAIRAVDSYLPRNES